jgi:hypothetical protein
MISYIEYEISANFKLEAKKKKKKLKKIKKKSKKEKKKIWIKFLILKNKKLKIKQIIKTFKLFEEQIRAINDLKVKIKIDQKGLKDVLN